MADLLAFGQAGRQRQRVEELSLLTVADRERAARVDALGSAATTFATHATVWTVLVLGIPMVRNGGLTGVDLAVVCLVAMAAFEAVQPLPAAARGLAEQLAAAERIFAILEARPAVDDPERPFPLEAGSLNRTGEPVLELRSLSFTYPGSTTPVLCGVDLEVVAGSRIAVVGPSGAGKSTLAHLLLRFWDPSAGEIRLAGRPLSAYSLEVLRSVVGVLPQRTDLFTGTIRSNLLLAAPGAGPVELERAADRAELLAAIRAQPDGWDTWIGEQGLQLSGGQRRRLAVARLVLRDPSLIVLDEPTSGLDPVTEQRMMGSLLGLVEGRTTIVITHRLVTMDRFDEIVVLDRGRIVERGLHGDLLAHGGLYRQLHDAQQLELSSLAPPLLQVMSP
jgi:ATP-binding cassette subfamily C protein CydC